MSILKLPFYERDDYYKIRICQSIKSRSEYRQAAYSLKRTRNIGRKYSDR